MGFCTLRENQSPIDLPAVGAVQQTGFFTYEYWPIKEPLPLINTGHALSADLTTSAYGGISLRGRWYSLLTINVHAASEHLWDGQRRPVELHLVHQSSNNDELVILAVALESGGGLAASSAAVQPLVVGPIPGAGQNVSVNAGPASPWSLETLVGGGEFFEYAGSLTAPPCTERATWLVRKESLMVSQSQIGTYRSAVMATTMGFGNYRTAMPLNGRTVRLLRAAQQDPSHDRVPWRAPVAPATVASAGSSIAGVHGSEVAVSYSGRGPSTRELANKAIRVAKSVAQNVKDLHQHLIDQAEFEATRLAT